MRNPHLFYTTRVFRTALKCASSFVPLTKREEWLREWTTELWYVQEAYREPSRRFPGLKIEVAKFCCGAFVDAVDMWRHEQPRARGLANPIHCLLFFFALAAISFLLAVSLPEVRNAFTLPPYRDVRRVVLISQDCCVETSVATVELRQFLQWKRQRQSPFTDLAFYQTIRRRVRVGPHRATELTIARASENLFALLGIGASLSHRASSSQSDDADRLASVLVSERIWHNQFHGDDKIVGRLILVAGREARITGVLSQGKWRLPGDPDLWLLEKKRGLDAIPMHSKGFVLARLGPALLPAQIEPDSTESWHFSVPAENGDVLGFTCTSLAHRSRQPLGCFLFALLLAAIALPATTSLPLGEYATANHRQTWRIRLRRWIFLLLKLGLTVPMMYFAALDLAYTIAPAQSQIAAFWQSAISFCGCLVIFRWVLRDQRLRCPVCLELLQNPARVGEPSRNFLSWNGTELICVGGHGFLHIPEIPTSWFDTQRWLYLDPSWKSLFDPHSATSLYL